ncbi:MAG TPA: COX15/CtaA family protein [Bacteroidota bacterium]|nr:COX15/CtaA family protein [Bacteroidota bacterium]
MSASVTHHKALHRFSVFCAVCTFFLIIAGGLVTSTGSSLAVPDWPLSYGQLMPPMVGGILYEHGHRMIASFVGLLTLILTVWLWRKEERRWVKILGITALGTVITQGLLGGLTVVLLLPTPISVAHATLAQTFFAIVSSIALFTSKWWIERAAQRPMDNDRTVFRLSLAAAAAVYVQLILGALMRHTGSGLAVPDFPLAYGQLIPSLSPDAIAHYNQQLIDSNLRLFADGPVTSGQILIHMLHRAWALVVTGVSIGLIVKLARSSSLPAYIRRVGYVLSGLIALQITLGAYTVLTQKAVAVATAHVAVGALLLVTLVLLTLRIARLYRIELKRFSFVYSTERALA